MIDLSLLRRRPDVEAPNLVAVDAADRLLLDETDAARAACAPAELVVVGDAFGALTLGSLSGFAERAAAAEGPDAPDAAPVRVHQDPLLAERALAANAAQLGLAGFRSMPLGPELVTGARAVLLRLPKSLDALDELAGLIAAHADPEVTVFAAGMVKHMTLTQNEVLGRHFGTVHAGLARQKARVLTARAPRSAAGGPWPRVVRFAEAGVAVAAHGGVFAGTTLDIGTRFLLQHLDDAAVGATTAVDLGCGNGVLAAALATRRPGIRVLAADQSAAAVASAAATMRLNGVAERVTVVRDDALAAQADASAELILLNPPFHTGTTVTAEVGVRLIADAARVLAPGGELRVVFNSHLRYQPTLRRLVGPTREVARNSKFTITSSTRR